MLYAACCMLYVCCMLYAARCMLAPHLVEPLLQRLLRFRELVELLLQLLRGHVRVGFSKFINVGLAGCAYCTTSPSVKGLVSMGAWACIGAVRVQALATTAQPAIMSMQQGGTRPVLCMDRCMHTHARMHGAPSERA